MMASFFRVLITRSSHVAIGVTAKRILGDRHHAVGRHRCGARKTRDAVTPEDRQLMRRRAGFECLPYFVVNVSDEPHQCFQFCRPQKFMIHTRLRHTAFHLDKYAPDFVISVGDCRISQINDPVMRFHVFADGLKEACWRPISKPPCLADVRKSERAGIPKRKTVGVKYVRLVVTNPVVRPAARA